MTMEHDDDLITMGEIAKRLGVNPGTVRNWRYRRQLPGPMIFSWPMLWSTAVIDDWAKRTGRTK